MAFTPVEVSDFVGKHLISKSSEDITYIQAYIDRYVPIYLAKVLGAELSTLFIAGMDMMTPPTIYTDINNPFQLDRTIESWCGCGCCNRELDRVVISMGIKDMLLGFIYFHYMVDNLISPSSTGGVARQKNDNSSIPDIPPAQVYERYNRAVDTAQAIQYKIALTKDVDYPAFNGECFKYEYYL